MFLALIYRPYHHEDMMNIPGHDLEGGVPVYLDGLAYTGIMNIQTVIQKWPGTAGIDFNDNSALKALKQQSARHLNRNPRESESD